MKICILTTSAPRFEGDTASIFIKRLAVGYSQAGTSGVLIMPQDADEDPTESWGNFEVLRFKYGIFSKGRLAFGAGIMPNLRRKPWLILQAPNLIIQMLVSTVKQRGNFDAVHAQWAVAGLAAWVLRRLFGKPYIVTVRGEDLKLLRHKFLRVLFIPVLSNAVAITSVSREFCNKLAVLYKGSIDESRIHFLPEGIEKISLSAEQAREVIQRSAPGITRPFFVMLARVIELKGIHNAVKLIASRALAQHDLIVCGDIGDENYAKRLRALAAELGVADRVHLIGAVKPDEVFAFLQCCTGLLHMSDYEGRPNAVLEGLNMGCFVAASDISAHRELIADGINGMLLNPIDTEGSADKIAKIIFDQEALQKIKISAETSVQDLSWQRCARRYLNLL